MKAQQKKPRGYLINTRCKAAQLNATESYIMYVAGSMKEEYEADGIYEMGSKDFAKRQREPQKLAQIGVDEVGRGCLAGPVYAGAVLFQSDFLIDQVTDSKLLSEKKRSELSLQIHRVHQVSLGFASVEEIEKLNILHASFLAMRRAVLGLGLLRAHVWVDGKFPIPDLPGYAQTPVIKGDLKIPVISAASIVAKVARDELMAKLEQEYPGYGLAKHKGYSTQFHKTRIQELGPTSIHRRQFAGVKEHL